MTVTPSRLTAAGVRLGYESRVVVGGLDLALEPGRITAVVGPNACGKSTLLKALARLLKPLAGVVHLDGRDIASLPTREVARAVGILPQSSVTPEGLTVTDLVMRGRYPHQGWLRPWSTADTAAVATAMDLAGVTDLADRPVDQLSGGQRQRAWIAMALAQDTPILLLDEPTTYLDLAHQVEVLDLVGRLNTGDGRTVVLVLHDLNHAARYAHQVVVMAEGAIVATGSPAEVISAELVERVYGLAVTVVPDPVTGTPLVVPRAPDVGPRFTAG
jgi:iron complex transport system ATP-binding protein